MHVHVDLCILYVYINVCVCMHVWTDLYAYERVYEISPRLPLSCKRVLLSIHIESAPRTHPEFVTKTRSKFASKGNTL